MITNILHDGIFRDVSPLIEIDEGIIHEDHSILFSSFEDTIHMLCFSTDDEISDGIIVDHNLSRNHSSLIIRFWEENL